MENKIKGTGRARKIDKKKFDKKKKRKRYPISPLYARRGLKLASEILARYSTRGETGGLRVHSSLNSNKSISEPMRDRLLKREERTVK